ncbi:hypothetical protein PAXRUDRAFT_16841 [Paxillus rubicundulus Ve08.2h10]|uniref:Uncharacterized protein n=1 Tax=Paxillus rubicundulus Ve08.2h10 TaxID=930991 RepID=A0A0D0DK07_9AGAM|nr:hypothetical protein PAXRUDRAFT_16841 [Paxillus rubicundulus Ve08.2h10]
MHSTALVMIFAAQLLSRAWRINNNKDKWLWATHIKAQSQLYEQNRLIATKEEAKCLRLTDEEHQAALKEEQPSFTLPSQDAICQLKKGTYCPLFYFTNKGLCEASQMFLTNNSDALILVRGKHGSHSFLPALSAQPISPSFVKDQHLGNNLVNLPHR